MSALAASDAGANNEDDGDGLPPARLSMESAQGTRAVRVAGLLTREEVSSVHAVAAAWGGRCGRQVRCVDAAGGATWSTTYLSTDSIFRREVPGVLEKVIAAARMVDATEAGLRLLAAGTPFAVRCVEYHEVRPGGWLGHAKHYDSGSLLTVDVMLVAPSLDFADGELVTDGVANLGDPAGRVDGEPCFRRPGDALVFCSHKHHHVEPVTRGTRHVLVVELWEGADRDCGHRCARARGPCPFRPTDTLLRDCLAEIQDEETRVAARRFLKATSASSDTNNSHKRAYYYSFSSSCDAESSSSS